MASWLGTREDEIIKEITPLSEMREKIEDVKKNIEKATREIGEGKRKFERLDAEAKSIQENCNQMEQRIKEDEAAVKKLDDETGKSKIN